jgi:CHAD domain-containing protein
MDHDVAKSRKRARRTGLASWMEQVLVCHTQALRAPDVRAVHQLRKALRRCRTLAGALREVDPTPEWRAMLKASRALFKALGGLRDTHVLEIWLDRLAPKDDAAGRNLRYRLNQREVELTAAARVALDDFDRDAWTRSIEPLAISATHHPPGDPLFEQLSMRRLLEAHDLHRRAMKGGSRTAWHDLRIGIKRLRYAVENFLPDQHTRWGDDLGLLQEALGDVHDLDVLWDELVSARLLGDDGNRAAWRQRLDRVRDDRLASYRKLMAGPGNLWRPWREELLAADRVEAANRAALGRWGAHHGSDPQRAAWLVQQLETMLYAVASLRPESRLELTRRLGVAAALLHGLAGPANDPVSRKQVRQRIAELPLPIDWSERQRDACGWILAGMRRRRLDDGDADPEIKAAVVQAARLLGLFDALAPAGKPLPELVLGTLHGGLTCTGGATGGKIELPRLRLMEALALPITVNPD